MKRGICLIALSAAFAVNGAALFATHVAMVNGAERERLVQQDVERVVITADRSADDVVATRNCTGSKAL
jgi:hypothetical protein